MPRHHWVIKLQLSKKNLNKQLSIIPCSSKGKPCWAHIHDAQTIGQDRVFTRRVSFVSSMCVCKWSVWGSTPPLFFFLIIYWYTALLLVREKSDTQTKSSTLNSRLYEEQKCFKTTLFFLEKKRNFKHVSGLALCDLYPDHYHARTSISLVRFHTCSFGCK